jgi:uncharacterized membrane protein YoaK (UPF0700 family)
MTVASAQPVRSEPGEPVRIGTLIVLTGVGGYVDAVSYLRLGRVFTAAMTGNTVLGAGALVGGLMVMAVPTVALLPALIAVAVLAVVDFWAG